MPAILGANSVSGYEISNSLIFNDNDSAYLGRTPGSAGTSVQTWTFSCWAKRSTLSGSQVIFGASNGDASQFVDITINGNNVFELDILDSNSTRTIRTTAAAFRDPSAWYHFVIVVDTTQGTAANRLKLYVNGDEIATVAGTGTFPAQNANTQVNATTGVHAIGRRQGSTDRYYDGYLTEINHVDGQALTPTSFGEEDDNGNWIPIRYSGNYGTNGFFLQFKQTGTSQNASGMGADTSGNTHHWTVNNLAALDVTTDTCTNNFATMNPLSNDAGGLTMSEGNLSMTCTTTRKNIKASFALPESGKWYWEWKFNEATGDSAIMNPSIAPVTSISDSSLEGSGIFAFWVYTADILYVKYNNSAARTNQNISFGTDDTMQFAVDMNTRRVYLGKNNTWYNTGTGTDGDPAAGTGYLATLSSTLEYAPSYAGETTSKTANVNFGQKAFAYTPPSGFFALNSTNLAKYG